MSKLKFDPVGERFYETGVKDCVLYPFSDTEGTFTEGNTKYKEGVAWNGITAITESPSGAEATAMYADNIKYLNLISNEDFGATLEAYTYPDEFGKCDGSAELVAGVKIGQQKRQMFGLCFKTAVGNDSDGSDYGYKIHLIYGCMAAPSERAYATINESPEAMTFSWEISTTPVDVSGFKPTAHLEIDSRTADETKLANLLDILYGKDGTGEGKTGEIVSHLPMPDVIKTLMTPDP